MAGRATGPETAKKKSKFFQSRTKRQSGGHRSTVSRISGLFYSKVLVLGGGGDTPPTGDVIGEVKSGRIHSFVDPLSGECG
jgi:hypothetical protein